MPRDGLNPRQERFCQAIVEGKPASRAYVEAGYSTRSPDQEASNLVRNPKVASRLAELQAKAVQKHEITMERLTEDLLGVYADARKNGQYSAAVAAHALIARMHGFVVDRAQVDIVHHKPARLPTRKLELTEAEWLRLYSPPQAIASPGRNGNGRNS
jgi:hypothetical protein